MHGLQRNIAKKIRYLLENFPVVTILGARQTGKTTLSKQLCPDWHYIDLEKPGDYELIADDPEFYFSRYPRNLIIDEAQELPVLFNILRGVIDANRNEKGRFIITGSSSPDLLNQVSESLAGRVAIVELGTLKANELFSVPLSPFYQLFTDKLSKSALETTTAQLTKEQLHTAWLKGGYPEPALMDAEVAYEQWMENYRTTYVNRDIARLFPRLNKVAFQRFLGTLSKLSGTILNKADLARAIEVSEPTIKEYLEIAAGTFLWRSIPSYEKNIIKSVIKMPKGHLRDTGLLHYLLKINSLNSLYEDPRVGHSFETFVTEEIIKGLQSTLVTNWDYYYYRTRNGSEVDLILHGLFGILPIEIKYGTKIDFKQLRSLKELIATQGAPFGLLINQADTAEWIAPTVFQLPATYL